jgi:uncharacterized SAM-binding protein YcdF (DUF218 family)
MLRIPLGGRHSRKIIVLIFVVAALASASWMFVSLGRILHEEDVLDRADVIVALGGSRYSRVTEAADLFREGWASAILVSPQLPEDVEFTLRERGIDVPGERELQVRALTLLGVPTDVISFLDYQVSTATEADAVRAQVVARGWRRLIVVTSKLHTTRAGLILRKRLHGTGATVIMRASRYDRSDVDTWWRSRSTLRFAVFEAQKLAAYWVGLDNVGAAR